GNYDQRRHIPNWLVLSADHDMRQTPRRVHGPRVRRTTYIHAPRAPLARSDDLQSDWNPGRRRTALDTLYGGAAQLQPVRFCNHVFIAAASRSAAFQSSTF